MKELYKIHFKQNISLIKTEIGKIDVGMCDPVGN